MRGIWLIAFSCLISTGLLAQEERKHIRDGNAYYYDGKLTEAEMAYEKALETKSDLYEGLFNTGNVFYQRDSFNLAADQFDVAAAATEDASLKAKAYHNKGNSLLQAGDYEGSVQAFKDALRNNPADDDSRYNLAYAMGKLKEQQQQEKQNKENKKEDEEKGDEEDQNQQNKDQEKDENQEDKEGQDNKDSKDPEEGDKGEGNESKKGDEENQQEREAQPREGQLSKEEAKRLLEALQNEEQKVQLKLQKVEKKGDKKNIEKDW